MAEDDRVFDAPTEQTRFVLSWGGRQIIQMCGKLIDILAKLPAGV